jgi:hypothetical protein
MKKVLLGVAIGLFLFSCSKNREQITIAKNEVEKKLSDIEKKGIDYQCTEMSDREAYEEIAEYHMKRLEKAEKRYNNFIQENNLGKYRIIPLDEMDTSLLNSYLKMMKLAESLLNEVTRHQESYSEDINILKKLEGNNTYYKVVSVKATPDTIIFNKVYLDNNSKVIITQYLK